MAEKAKKKRSSYKMVAHKMTVADALENGRMELEELYGEMNEWADNMDSGGLGHTEKYERIREAADALQDAESASVPELPAEVGDKEIEIHLMEIRSRKRSPSRATRCSNAVSQIRGALETIDEFYNASPKDEKGEDLERPYELDDFENLVDNADGVEFPGMFG